MASFQANKSLQGLRSNHVLFELLAHQVGKIVTPAHATCSIPPLYDFIGILVHRSRTRTGTLLVALVLLTRLSQRLGHVTTGMATSPQRIILASLIISTKLIHDTSPKNIYWKRFANDYFELNEINLMEKQLLTLLDFNLSISYTDFQNAVHCYQQYHSSSSSRNNNYINNDSKAWWWYWWWYWWWRWQEIPEDVSPGGGQNVAVLAVNKNTYSTTIIKALTIPNLLSSSPSTMPVFSSSSQQSISLSSTPLFDRPHSNDTSPASSPLDALLANGTVCDIVGSSWSHPTTFVTPLFSA